MCRAQEQTGPPAWAAAGDGGEGAGAKDRGGGERLYTAGKLSSRGFATAKNVIRRQTMKDGVRFWGDAPCLWHLLGSSPFPAPQGKLNWFLVLPLLLPHRNL